MERLSHLLRVPLSLHNSRHFFDQQLRSSHRNKAIRQVTQFFIIKKLDVVFQLLFLSLQMIRTIRPTDHPLLGILTLGEGWHNYHHVFPWDYKTAELGNYRYNMTTGFIDFFAKLGEFTLISFLCAFAD